MDSMYWDVFPADDSESSSDEEDNECAPSLEVPCARCKDRKHLCKRCKRRQQISTAGARKSSLEKACFPPRATSSDAPAPVPEVLLPSPDDETPTPRNGAAAPVYAAMYTASPSWMSTYTSSTCATTYTAAHERSQRETGPLLEVAGQHQRRRMQPRRPRMSERRRSSGWQTSELEGWDEREIDGGGSYWDVEGARWEEQRIRTPERRAQKRVWQNERVQRAPVKGVARRRKWDEQKGELRWRSRPLVEPLTPRYVHDVVMVHRARLLEMAFVSGKGHSRVVFGMAYARGTAHARGLFFLPAPKYEPFGDGSGYTWREGIWNGLVGWLWGTERGPAVDLRDID